MGICPFKFVKDLVYFSVDLPWNDVMLVAPWWSVAIKKQKKTNIILLMICIFLISVVLFLVHANSEILTAAHYSTSRLAIFFFLIVMKWWDDPWRHKRCCQVHIFAFSVCYLSYSQLLKVLVCLRVWTQVWPEQTLFHLFHEFSSVLFFFPLITQKRTISNLSGMLICPYELMFHEWENSKTLLWPSVLGSSGLYRDGDWNMSRCLSEGVRRCLCNSQFMKCNIWHMCSKKVDFLGWNDSGCFLLGCLPPDFQTKEVSKWRYSHFRHKHIFDVVFFFMIVSKKKYNITLLYYS